MCANSEYTQCNYGCVSSLGFVELLFLVVQCSVQHVLCQKHLFMEQSIEGFTYKI